MTASHLPCLERSSLTALRMLHFIWSGGMELGLVVVNLSWLLTNVLMSLRGRVPAEDVELIGLSSPFILAAISSDSSETNNHE